MNLYKFWSDKILFGAIFFILFCSLSCSYEKTNLDIGSLFDPTWDFSKSSNLSFNENYVEIKNNKAQLKPIDLKSSGADFEDGTHVGSSSNGSDLERGLTLTLKKLTDIRQILPSKNDQLIGYWQFNSSFADELSNLSFAANGDSNLVAPAQDGSEAASFDGTGDYAQNSADIRSQISNSLSISVWIKPRTSGGFDGIFGFGGNGDLENVNHYFYIALASGADVRVGHEYGAGTNEELLVNTNLVLGNWVHLVAIKDNVRKQASPKEKYPTGLPLSLKKIKLSHALRRLDIEFK